MRRIGSCPLVLPKLVMVLPVLGGLCACGDDSSGTKNFKASELFFDAKVTAFAEALRRNDTATCDRLLREGVNINATGDKGITLPIWSMWDKNKAMFTWLFDHGADPNLLVPGDRGVLMYAAVAEDSDWLRILIGHKANVNLISANNVGKTTPISDAILYRRKKHLEMLIQAGADVNLQRPGGDTPIVEATSIGWFEGAYMLLQAGADCRQRATEGFNKTAYYAAFDTSSPESEDGKWKEKILQYLRDHGEDVEGAAKQAQETKKLLKER